MSYYSPIIAASVTFALIAVILSSSLSKKLQDIPNQRSLHTSPIPRIGGVGLMVGLLSGWALIYTVVAWWLLLPMVGLFAISLLDDMHGLAVQKRLPAHLAAAIVLVGGSGLLASQGIVIALVVLLLTVWMTNLYNFMDGSDGLAGGMALFGFSAYGIAAFMAHNVVLAVLDFTISAATLGFLYFNFPPARVFMGDAGSIPLGFLVAAMGLWGWQQGCWTVWFPLLVFSPFIADASVTLMKRTLRGAKITDAHREHYYQHAVQLGWGHRKVALAEYVLMLGSGMSALFTLGQKFPWGILLAWFGIYCALMLLIDAAWKEFDRGPHA
jgi:UDP-N-acetylmuramyl pentapeptide phosphotransferase/UDP-N-acetylglucosamine-1-phosphate transferase